MISDTAYPVLLLCGGDPNRRDLMKVLDPDGLLPSKALLPMAGKRVLDWQLDAMIESPDISDIYLIGLSPDEFPSDLDLKYVQYERNSSILEKIKYGSLILQRSYPDLDHIIVCSGDAPGVTTSSINQFFDIFRQNLDADFLIGVVPEDITLKFFPNHRRVIGKFKDMSVYPGEMYIFRHKIIPVIEDEILQMTLQRRQFDRQKDTSKLVPVLKYLGRKPRLWLLIIKYGLGLLSISELESILSRVYNLNMKAIIIPDPGFGMDLDLPEDYESISEYIKMTKIQV
jgi:CTP:molybdopterin cytidylyltransferase MocA